MRKRLPGSDLDPGLSDPASVLRPVLGSTVVKAETLACARPSLQAGCLGPESTAWVPLLGSCHSLGLRLHLGDRGRDASQPRPSRASATHGSLSGTLSGLPGFDWFRWQSPSRVPELQKPLIRKRPAFGGLKLPIDVARLGSHHSPFHYQV